jgi:pyocin large subunit-like protein
VLPLLSGGGDPVDPEDPGNPEEYVQYTFRNEKLLKEHFEKHGIEMGFSSEEEYQQAASDVANDPEALHKLEKEDGDDVYYLEETNEFVVVSTDGFIRTYFCPDSGIKYFEKQ